MAELINSINVTFALYDVEGEEGGKGHGNEEQLHPSDDFAVLMMQSTCRAKL